MRPVISIPFYLVMEVLNVALKEVVPHGIFRGAVIGDGGLVLSHLFYADDALFLGE